MRRLLVSKTFPLYLNAINQDAQLISGARSSESKSSNLLQHTGMTLHSSPGIYHFAPPLLRSVDKLEKIIDKHLFSIGGQKFQMSTLCPQSLWMKTGRWDEFGEELLKTSISKTNYCLCPTHEESICHIVSNYAKTLSFKHLPLRLYQTTKKFRGEIKPFAGLLRCREFLMNDMYTFDFDCTSAMQTYEQVVETYDNIFSEIGLDVLKAEANTGIIGGSLSHEYHVKSDVGEDTLLICKDTGKILNTEINENFDLTRFEQVKGIEVGHLFLLGTKYSKVFGTKFSDEKKNFIPFEMGCYGLGVTRIIAACLETLSTENQIRWPVTLAPYKVCILPPKAGSKEETACSLNFTNDLYDKLQSVDLIKDDIIIDDRTKQTIGWRLKQADLFGYPLIIVVGKSSLSDNPTLEIITQNVVTDKQFIPVDHACNFVRDYFANS